MFSSGRVLCIILFYLNSMEGVYSISSGTPGKSGYIYSVLSRVITILFTVMFHDDYAYIEDQS